jgi:hypothetical protein
MFFVAQVISQLKWEYFRTPRPLYDLDRYEEASRGVWGSTLFLFSRVRP